MAFGFNGVEPLKTMAIEEGPVGDGDESGEDDTTGIDEEHQPERPLHVTSDERRDREGQQQNLHQLLSQPLSLPIHCPKLDRLKTMI